MALPEGKRLSFGTQHSVEHASSWLGKGQWNSFHMFESSEIIVCHDPEVFEIEENIKLVRLLKLLIRRLRSTN